MNLFVQDIARLLTLVPAGDEVLGEITDGAVLILDGKIRYAGPRKEFSLESLPFATPILSAQGRLVTPGLVDPHTHAVFAGSRSHEFDLRNRGASYGEIQAQGGGILSTVRATRGASDDVLLTSTLARLDRFLSHGTVAIEGKSGYDLTPQGELRLLRILADARLRHAVDISPTLLCHVPPPELGDAQTAERRAFIDAICDDAIPTAKREGIADAVDVYCDAGAFTLDETRRILVSARARGLALRVHAEQFTHTGAAELAAELGARSVEHLEQLSQGAPALLAKAGTVCTILPGAALTLRLPWPDARRMIAAGCTVAIGTDCNPGSSLSESQPLMMSLATTQMGLSTAEAWQGVTTHAARALGRDDVGVLREGAAGHLVLWNTDDPREVAQHLGAQLVHEVIVAGDRYSADARPNI